MMNRSRSVIFAAVVMKGILVLQPGVTVAQTTGAQASRTLDAAAKARQIEEVVVQARRIDESQQDVPIAVSTVTSNRLVEAVVSSVDDIQRLVPSLQVQQSVFGTTDFRIRGAFAGFDVDPSVLTYFDEVPIDSRALVYATFDLNSVQQLKGPQGTLFGKNSTGGAVLFFSQRPRMGELSGYFDARYGRYNDRRLEGAVNVPVADTLAFRLAAEYQLRDGTVESVTRPGLEFNERDNYSIRGSLLWQPTDRFENYTQFTFYRAFESRTPRRPIDLAGPCTGPNTPALTCLFAPPFNSILGTDDLQGYVEQQFLLPDDKTTLDRKLHANSRRDSLTNTFTIDMNAVTLKNTTSYGYTRFLFGNDWDGTPARVVESVVPEEHHELYSETQLYGEALDGRLDWRVGGVYIDDDGSEVQHTTVFPLPVSLSTPNTTSNSTRFKSYALFGEVTYDLSALLNDLSLTAGYRYTWDRRTLRTRNFAGAPVPVCQLQTLPVPPGGAVPYPGTDLSTCTRNLSLKSSSPNYNFTLSWVPIERILLYASTRRGYKAGSFNTFPPQDLADLLADYAPEIIKDIEVGMKADWLLGDIPLRTNVAAFNSRYTDLQVSETYVSPTGAPSIVIQNRNPLTGQSNRATIKGYEVEAAVTPFIWLELTAFYSRVSAKFKEFTPLTGVDLSGQNVGGVIPSTFGVTGVADIPLSGPFDGMRLTASYYKAGAPLRNIGSTDTVSGADSIDARLEFSDVFRTGVDLAIYGDNLGDTRVCTFNRVVSGLGTAVCGEHTTYGVQIRREFGGAR